MPRTLNKVICPKCKKVWEYSLVDNRWLPSPFGEYNSGIADHICEKCGCDFKTTVKMCIYYSTKINKGEKNDTK